MNMGVEAIRWTNDRLELLDQRLLPEQELYIECRISTDVAQAITQMVVRGAPAIGITAAYGVVLAGDKAFTQHQEDWKPSIKESLDELARSRPTAVNLFWALQRMNELIEALAHNENPMPKLLAEAEKIHREDIEANQRMGKFGTEVMMASSDSPFAVITHCNTGSLATGGFGTALGVIRFAWDSQIITHV